MGTFQNKICRELCMWTQGSEHIQRVLCLFYLFVPQDRSKPLVTRAEACNDVILKLLNSTLCCVHTVIVWFYQLYHYFLLLKVLLDCIGSNNFDDVEDGFGASFCQLRYVALECSYRRFILQIFHECCKDGIGRPVVKQKNYGIPFHWHFQKFSCEVDVDCTIFWI